MSKTKRKPTPKKASGIPDKSILPQNIVGVGERVLENKNIYISQNTYKTIHKFTKSKTVNESGGILVGYTVKQFGKTNIVITGFVEAKFCEATPTTLKFTHETWDSCHKEIDKNHPDSQIVGWIHTHPDFGIFLSEYDKFIQNNFFNAEDQIAYVIDPIKHEEGFYFWVNGKIERCVGFYLYDKTGVKITAIEKAAGSAENTEAQDKLTFDLKDFAIVALAAALVIIICAALNLQIRMKELESNLQSVAVNTNQSLNSLETELDALRTQVSSLSKDKVETNGEVDG